MTPAFSITAGKILELGVRLKQLGLQLIKAPGGSWLSLASSLCAQPTPDPDLIENNNEGVWAFVLPKTSTWPVRMMIQMTWLHRLLWSTLTLGGQLNEQTLAPLLQWLVDHGRSQLALEIARTFLNWYSVQEVYAAYAQGQQTDACTGHTRRSKR